MSRQTKENATAAFRAVVMTHYPASDGREASVVINVYGPYQNIGAARAAAKREGQVWGYSVQRGITKTSKIQRSSLAWEDIEP
ncbi:hypothetical protein [Terracoccus sp. 273MFTsu3.1]|uniref:hypothetical protein n=1 Tax=Terracoccus sp. 273MFTsu3.1 TaxID=1172188 RepID=UPI0003814365|nr:hypothetical protein [Terracoccus sp. 273MFTsu3.1]